MIVFGVFMNHWTKASIDYANQKNYLDELFRVYPTIPDGIRDLDKDKCQKIEKYFLEQNNLELIKTLLKCDIFPIKDSYVAYLKRDITSLERNPQTINRLAGRLYEMGLDKIMDKCSEPKETNRQIGPLFKRWIKTGILGIKPVDIKTFVSNNDNAVLDATDKEMEVWARENINYKRNKGLDFVARFNKKYIIGEAKFLTDFGGHQNAQFEDAIATLKTKDVNAIKIAILDGVLYINSNNKMHKSLLEECKHHDILSALVLRDYLYSI